MTLEEYFDKYPWVKAKLRIRGGKEVDVVFVGVRIYVKAHKQKLFVVALKYEGEEHYRYLVASDMSWRAIDILDVQKHKSYGLLNPLYRLASNFKHLDVLIAYQAHVIC